MTKDSNKELTAEEKLKDFIEQVYVKACLDAINWEDNKGKGKELCKKRVEQVLPAFMDLIRSECKRFALECVPEIEKAHTYASENADDYRIYDAGQESMRDRMIKNIEEKSK